MSGHSRLQASAERLAGRPDALDVHGVFLGQIRPTVVPGRRVLDQEDLPGGAVAPHDESLHGIDGRVQLRALGKVVDVRV